ncbi:MAG: lamin tail domain-containing protein [Acidobacteria bacterium]|nr:lamin tail domain-containing protein [Acidobacteriota bacterium]
MNVRRVGLFCVAVLAALPALAQNPPVVISQVYGGGGNTGAPYQNDFVELFNRSAATVNLSGYSIQYTSSAGTSWGSQQVNLPGFDLQPGQYYLVKMQGGANGSAFTADYPATGTAAFNMSATSAKLLLSTSTTPQTVACPTGMADLVPYGTSANCSPRAAAPSNTTALFRAGSGCTYSGDPSVDFTTAAPSPRNSSSPMAPCTASSNPSGSGSAAPNPVVAGNATLLSATITPGTPAAAITSVTCDLSAAGGSAAFALSGSGASFSASYTVPAATTPRGYMLPCTVTDANSRTGTFNIALTVSSSSVPPAATGSANPASVQAGNQTSLSATVTPGSNPASTNTVVSCNLTAIGGGATFSLPAPDYSANYTVPAATAANAYSLPCVVSDDQARSSNFTIALTVAAPPPMTRRIYEITGSGTNSPLAGQTAEVRGVVTAVRAATSSGKGFYIESLPADRDSDPNTSEGLLVFVGSAALPACAVVGNVITIDGTVQDYVSSTAPVGSLPLTELSSTSNCQVVGTNSLGSLPAAVTIDAANPLAADGAATQVRKWLGMRVAMPNAVVVGPSLGSLTEATAQAVATGEYFVTLPGVARPQRGAGILATRRPNDAAGTVPSYSGSPEVMRINVTQLAPAGAPYEVTVGATISGLSGVIDYNTSDGDFELFTNSSGAGTPTPSSPTMAATPVPAALPGDLTIGSFNMERFYNDVADGNGAAAISTAAYQGRLNKASLAIRDVMRMPDIIGLEEVEGKRNSVGANDPHVIDAIVSKVNADAAAAGQGNPNYGWCIGVTNDPSAIVPAIMYKQDKVQVSECAQYGIATHYNEPDGGNNFLNDRPPVTIKATVKAAGSDSGIPLRLVVNHLKALSGIDQPGAGNGDQVRTKRNQQALFLAGLINGTSGEQATNWNTADNLVLVGDFNAYHVNDGYVDVMNCIAGNPPVANTQYFTAAQLAVDTPCAPILSPAMVLLTALNPAAYYSYLYSGAIQTLDHVLVNAKLYPRFRQLAYARNNAEFSEGPVYRNDFTRPERVSDHDMPVLYVTLPVEVSSRAKLNASAPLLVRGTGRYTARLSVTNTGAVPLTGPVYVFFTSLTPGVTLPDLPRANGMPYAAINLASPLPPGATSGTVTISFLDPTNAPIGYTTARFDGTY